MTGEQMLVDKAQALTEGVEISKNTLPSDMRMLINRQIVIIEELQGEIQEQFTNLSNPGLFDALRSATTVLNELAAIKSHFESKTL